MESVPLKPRTVQRRLRGCRKIHPPHINPPLQLIESSLERFERIRQERNQRIAAVDSGPGAEGGAA